MRYQITGSAMEDVGTLWSMQHGDRRARCALLAWEGDWEIRVLVDGTTLLAQKCEGPAAAFTLAEEWTRRLSLQGWRQILPKVRGAATAEPLPGARLS